MFHKFTYVMFRSSGIITISRGDSFPKLEPVLSLKVNFLKKFILIDLTSIYGYSKMNFLKKLFVQRQMFVDILCDKLVIKGSSFNVTVHGYNSQTNLMDVDLHSQS